MFSILTTKWFYKTTIFLTLGICGQKSYKPFLKNYHFREICEGSEETFGQKMYQKRQTASFISFEMYEINT